MGLYINGKKVAGRGISGLSPYQIAQNEGYSGTESEFYAQLKAVGLAAEPFNRLEDKIMELELNVDQAKTEIINAEMQARQAALAAETAINTKIDSLLTDVFAIGSTPPSNTKLLWIDTTANTGGLKYYNGSNWTHVPVAWT